MVTAVGGDAEVVAVGREMQPRTGSALSERADRTLALADPAQRLVRSLPMPGMLLVAVSGLERVDGADGVLDRSVLRASDVLSWPWLR
jgi:hypothetical protein